MNPPKKTPPFGMPRKQSATIDQLHDRMTALEVDAKETGERLARVETKQDFSIELLAEIRREQYAEREARTMALAEAQKTERVRIGSRAKVIAAAFAAAGVLAGAVAAVLTGCA